MASWTPPKTGTPCWVEIAASDVGRAKEFYRSVFGWTFKPMPPQYSEDEVAMFSFPDEKLEHLGGGIVHSDADPKSRSGRQNLVYLYVHDIEEMLAKVTEAGGKAIGEKHPESDNGWIQHFEDTEGNYCGMYTAKKAN